MKTEQRQHCETCGHYQVVRNWSSHDGAQANEKCLHPTGTKQMTLGCVWHSDGALMRIKSNRVFG